MFSYIARQPIFDSNLEIVGYELLYRDGPNNAFPNGTTSGITQKIFVEQHLTYHTILIGDKLGFVNFDYDDLINELPQDFPKDAYVIEILETCEPDDELFHSLQNLKNNGYTIALDDFGVNDKRWKAFTELADIIKFDIQAYPLKSIKNLVKELKANHKKLLAEKVETYDEYHEAKSLGFELFQGYFFSKPEVVKRNKLDEVFKANIELLQEVSKDSFSVSTVEKIISKSTTLTIRLLNYVNSQVSIRSKISSLNQAISYLGKDRLKRFSSHLLISWCPIHKPNVLFINSLYRAHLLQDLAKSLYDTDVSNKAFITGMLSLIDALLDMEMSGILSNLNLDEDITTAISERKGQLGELLLLTEALEQGDWDFVSVFQLKHQQKLSSVSQLYMTTIENINKYVD